MGNIKLIQDQTTLSGGLGISWMDTVELGAGLPQARSTSK